MSTINERFELIIQRICENNKSRFAKMVGVSPSVIENVVGKRQGKPSFDFISAVVSKCECISAEWLLTGEGPMLKSPAENTHNNSDSVKFPADTNNTSRDPAVADSPPVGVPAYIQPLLDRIAQQAELIGRLRAQIEQLSAKVDELSLRDGNVTDVHSGSGLNCG